MGTGLESWNSSAWRRKVLGRCINVYKYLMEGVKTEQASSQWYSLTGQELMGRNLDAGNSV